MNCVILFRCVVYKKFVWRFSLSHSYRARQFITWNENTFYLRILPHILGPPRCLQLWKFLVSSFWSSFHWVRTLSRFPIADCRGTKNAYEDEFDQSNLVFFLITKLNIFSFHIVIFQLLGLHRMHRSFNMSCRVLIFCTQDSSLMLDSLMHCSSPTSASASNTL